MPRSKNAQMLSFIYTIEMHVFWMINIGNFAELLFKSICKDFKLEKCLFHQKFNEKIIITH